MNIENIKKVNPDLSVETDQLEERRAKVKARLPDLYVDTKMEIRDWKGNVLVPNAKAFVENTREERENEIVNSALADRLSALQWLLAKRSDPVYKVGRLKISIEKQIAGLVEEITDEFGDDALDGMDI